MLEKEREREKYNLDVDLIFMSLKICGCCMNKIFKLCSYM